MIVILFVALGGVMVGMGAFSSSDDLGYNTMGLLDGAYNTPGSTSAVSHPVSGVALPVSSTSRTLFHHTVVPSYNAMATPALSGGSYAAQGLTLTSQGATNAFGGGGSSASYAGTMHTSSRGVSYAMGVGSTGGGYRTGSSRETAGNMRLSTFSAGTSMNSTFSPAVYAAPMAVNNDFSAREGAFNPLYGGVVATADWVSASSVGNRRRISSIGGVWLQDWIDGIIGNGTDGAYYGEVDGVKTFREDELYQAYLAALQNGDMPEGVTWEQFKEWFTGKGYQFYDSPLPDGTLLLLLLAAMMTFITYRRRTRAQA